MNNAVFHRPLRLLCLGFLTACALSLSANADVNPFPATEKRLAALEAKLSNPKQAGTILAEAQQLQVAANRDPKLAQRLAWVCAQVYLKSDDPAKAVRWLTQAGNPQAPDPVIASRALTLLSGLWLNDPANGTQALKAAEQAQTRAETALQSEKIPRRSCGCAVQRRLPNGRAHWH